MTDKLIDYAAIGVKIRQKRDSLGLSQEAVSEKLGISASFYGHVERGGRILSVETLIKIATYYDMSLDYLFPMCSGTNAKLQLEFDNIFRGKTSTQADYLLNVLKVLADGIDRLAV